jgi:quinol monooxygenase YgiN
MRQGKRDVLIDLFEREFIESQEDAGMSVIGHFRDLDDPNRFVWLRGFRSAESRAASLTAFYHGDLWKSHRDAANATLLDNDDVLMLRLARPGSGFDVDPALRPASNANSSGLVTSTLWYLGDVADDEITALFEQRIAPELRRTGADVIAYLVSDSSPNEFPALPVRERERVFVWFSLFADERAHAQHLAALAQSADWCDAFDTLLARLGYRRPERTRLSPAARSLVHA